MLHVWVSDTIVLCAEVTVSAWLCWHSFLPSLRTNISQVCIPSWALFWYLQDQGLRTHAHTSLMCFLKGMEELGKPAGE